MIDVSPGHLLVNSLIGGPLVYDVNSIPIYAFVAFLLSHRLDTPHFLDL